MLSRLHRFHGLGSLSFVYRKGNTARSQLVSLKFIENNRMQSYRTAVVVSRKVHKSAVVRNRIRRRIYAIVRQELPAVTPPFDLVFTVFGDRIATMNSEELQQIIRGLLQKAGLC